MKSLSELTEDEILQLTNENVRAMALYRCAEEGVRIVEEPAAPVQPALNPSMCFEVNGIHTSDEDFAKKLAELLLQNRNKICHLGYWSYGAMPIRKLEPAATPAAISQAEYFTEASYRAAEASIKEYDASKAQYDSAKALWETARKKIEDYAKPIRDRISELKGARAHLQELIKQMKTYLELAEGDQTIAKRFFEKAFASLSSATKRKVYEACDFPQVSGGRVV